MTDVIDRIESTVRHLLRMQPKPSTEARVTPFIRNVRDIRRDALSDERAKKRTRTGNPLVDGVFGNQEREPR